MRLQKGSQEGNNYAILLKNHGIHDIDAWGKGKFTIYRSFVIVRMNMMLGIFKT
jgi:hypothetical protein